MVSAKHLAGVERGKLIPLGNPDIVFQQAHVLVSILSHASENNTAQIQGHLQPPRARVLCLSGFPPCLASGKERQRFIHVPVLPLAFSLPFLPASSLSLLFFTIPPSQLATKCPCLGRPMASGSSEIQRGQKLILHQFGLWVTLKLPGKASAVQPDTSDHGPGLYPVPFSDHPGPRWRPEPREQYSF